MLLGTPHFHSNLMCYAYCCGHCCAQQQRYREITGIAAVGLGIHVTRYTAFDAAATTATKTAIAPKLLTMCRYTLEIKVAPQETGPHHEFSKSVTSRAHGARLARRKYGCILSAATLCLMSCYMHPFASIGPIAFFILSAAVLLHCSLWTGEPAPYDTSRRGSSLCSVLVCCS